ncbi:MAG: peptidoglycan DD-metalloendopeptidase family protein [Rikenellaceae bacterium]|nr:peptidoglycan DD-metalloendopeptidase family protein [Rikenellaceae bacterium]
MRRLLTLLVVLAASMAGVVAQQRPTIRLSDRPHRPIDTLATEREGVKLVLYSDLTYDYIDLRRQKWAEDEIFCGHWDTLKIFAYRDIELKDLPEEIEVKLLDALDDYHCPVMGRIVSRYGPRGRRNHNGIDLALKTGEPIHATFPGRVRYATYNTGGFGNLIILRHPNGLETYYAHLSRINVKVGDWVAAGEVIGYGGSTGRSRGPHLHFEVRYCDQTFDPQHLIDFETGNLKYGTFLLERRYFNIRSRATEGLEDDESLIDPSALVSKADSDSISAAILAEVDRKDREAAAKAAEERAAKYHTIRSGDTLGGIARRYGTSVSAICRLNGISTKTTLRIGRKLRVR